MREIGWLEVAENELSKTNLVFLKDGYFRIDLMNHTLPQILCRESFDSFDFPTHSIPPSHVNSLSSEIVRKIERGPDISTG